MERDEAESATGTLHRLTSYHPDRDVDQPADDPRIRQDLVANDLGRLTPQVKAYGAGLPRTALPRELAAGRGGALGVLGGAGSGSGSAAEAAGVAASASVAVETPAVATSEAATRDTRVAAEAAAVEGAEAATRDASGAGVAAEAATRDASGAGVAAEAVEHAEPAVDLAALGRLLFLSSGVVRTRQRDYGPQLFRAAGSAGNRFPLELYVAIPAGSDLPPGVHWYDPQDHALVQIGPPPAGSGAPTVVVTGVPWRTGWRYAERGYRHIYWDCGTMLSQLLVLADSAGLAPRLFTRFPDAAVSDLVGADRVNEWPVAVVALGNGAPSIAATGPSVAGVTDADPVEFPLVTAAQHAGDLDRLGEPWDFPVAAETPTAESPTIDEVIIKRGSQRRMDPSRGLPLETLRTSMTVALRGIDIPHWIAVHDVTGLPSGVYRWPDLENPVRSEHQDALRAELLRVCLDQTLGRDAAFVVISATDVAQLSDRGYREAQLAAGLVEGRLHLAAYALGASATGMTFLDTEIPALLAAPEAPHGLIFTCVGVPGNTSKPAGFPGTPTEIRLIPPRE